MVFQHTDRSSPNRRDWKLETEMREFPKRSRWGQAQQRRRRRLSRDTAPPASSERARARFGIREASYLVSPISTTTTTTPRTVDERRSRGHVSTRSPAGAVDAARKWHAEPLWPATYPRRSINIRPARAPFPSNARTRAFDERASHERAPCSSPHDELLLVTEAGAKGKKRADHKRAVDKRARPELFSQSVPRV